MDHATSSGAGRSRDELVAWLDDHTDYERSMPTRALAPTLRRIEELCGVLGNPELSCPVIHLTGTNGKGSTARMVTELLRADGLVVGTYTSPNLARVNERLARDGEPIDDEELAEVLGALALIEPMLEERPTRFELLTAAAFRWFADCPVDVAVVEVGLGGRWDATNVVRPAVAVVTNVSYDHVEILGPTLADIAREKAGVVKAHSTLVLGETDPQLAGIFLAAAAEAGNVDTWMAGDAFGVGANRPAVGGRVVDLRTPQAEYPEVFLALHGAHQGDNAACALAAAEAFFGAPLDPAVVEEALATVSVPGRMEVVGRTPLTILDGAHNVAGAEALATTLREEFRVLGDTVVVVGMLHGRDPSAVLQALIGAGASTVVACTAPSARALAATWIAEAARALGVSALSTDSVDDAITLALARVSGDGVLVVTGSLYVVAEARGRFVSSPSQQSD